MELSRLCAGAGLTLRELLRDRMAVLLLFVVPAVFFSVVAVTTSDLPVSFQLASVPGSPAVLVSSRSGSLTFMALASVGFLAAFVAMNLVRRDAETTRRLLLCGFGPAELLLSRLAVLLLAVAAVAIFVAAGLLLFFRPERLGAVAMGLALGGFVYGSYGLLVGALVRGELEAILLVVLLANIDAGWLQNPAFYAEAQGKVLVRSLPAYFPSQACMVAAFTDYPVSGPALGSLCYGAALLLAALLAFGLRMRTFRRGASIPPSE